MKKQNILISLLAIFAVTACTSNNNGKDSQKEKEDLSVFKIDDFGTAKFEAENFDSSNWESDAIYGGATVIQEEKASGGAYLAAGKRDSSGTCSFSFVLAKYSKVTFSAAYAQIDGWLEDDLDMEKTYFYSIESVSPFTLPSGKNILKKRTSDTNWELMSYDTVSLHPGTYKVTLSVVEDTPNGCPSIDYVQFKTTDATTVDPSKLTEDDIPENDFHNLQQYKLLADGNWENFATYANGGDYSAPRALKLKYDELETANTYYFQVSEDSSFANAPVRQSANKYYEFYNAKLSTKYYYRAATSEAGLASAQAKELTTTDLAPRVVNVPKVLNFRDIGGWETSLVPGAKLKQGLYFRCAQLNQAGYSSTRSELDSEGKGLAAIKELGIKVDIDMRDSGNVPNKSPADTADWPVKLVKASVASSTESGRWEGYHDLDKNIAKTYKSIFETIAKIESGEEGYGPVALHCTYGADRTGIVSFFLEALLGVDLDDIRMDYVWTKFTQGRDPNPNGELAKWIEKTEDLEGDNFADKMEKHLMDFDISLDTLETIRAMFIPGYVKKSA